VGKRDLEIFLPLRPSLRPTTIIFYGLTAARREGLLGRQAWDDSR
jgi:hypothetical protein